MQGSSAKQLASYSGGVYRSHPSCLNTCNTQEMFNWHSQPMYSPPLPPICGGTAQSHGWVSVTRTSSFSQDTSGVFAEIKIRTVKRNTCEANGKRNTELSRVVSAQFRRDKNSGEGWGGGEWKAPNPEANEKQEPAGLGGAEKIQAWTQS